MHIYSKGREQQQEKKGRGQRIEKGKISVAERISKPTEVNKTLSSRQGTQFVKQMEKTGVVNWKKHKEAVKSNQQFFLKNNEVVRKQIKRKGRNSSLRMKNNARKENQYIASKENNNINQIDSTIQNE